MVVFICAVVGVLSVLALVFTISHSHGSSGFNDAPKDLGPKGGDPLKYPNRDHVK